MSFVKTKRLLFITWYSVMCGKPWSLMYGVTFDAWISLTFGTRIHCKLLSFVPYHSEFVWGSCAKHVIGFSFSNSYWCVPYATSVMKILPSFPAVMIWFCESADC